MRRGWDSIEVEGRYLVKLNQSEVPSIVRSYLFPDEGGETIRVVHVDSKGFPEDHVTPIEFAPDPEYRLFHRMFVAIVDPGAAENLQLPPGWGAWSDATVIERAKRRKAG
jgi:hypothetical protein